MDNLNDIMHLNEAEREANRAPTAYSPHYHVKNQKELAMSAKRKAEDQNLPPKKVQKIDIQAPKQIDIPQAQDDEYREVAWAKARFGQSFEPIWINRPKVSGSFVKFEMLFCGICHSDLHLGNNDLGGSMYPIVPGHELIGKVTEVGPDVTKVKIGDRVGVGCIIDSCLDCQTCHDGEENYCENGGSTHTYNTLKGKYEQFGKKSHFLGNKDTQNFGGYSGSNVVHEHFIVKIPDQIPLEAAGPLLCAGITMYDPLCHWGAVDGTKTMTIGIIGIGGLGTMGVKMARALGHKVVAISTTKEKEDLCKQKGANDFICSTCPDSMKAGAKTCDLILNTVSAPHQVETYLPLLNTDGVIVMLGLVTQPHSVNQLGLLMSRKTIAGSTIGGIKNT